MKRYRSWIYVREAAQKVPTHNRREVASQYRAHRSYRDGVFARAFLSMTLEGGLRSTAQENDGKRTSSRIIVIPFRQSILA